MAAFLAFVVAAVLAVLAAVGTTLTDNDTAWALVFIAVGLALAHLPSVNRP